MQISRLVGIALFGLGVVGFLADLGGVAQGLETLYSLFRIPLTYDTFVLGLMAIGILVMAVSLRPVQERPGTVRLEELRWCVDDFLMPELNSRLRQLEARIRSHNWDLSSEARKLYVVQHRIFREALERHRLRLAGQVSEAEIDSVVGDAYWTCLQLRAVAAVAERYPEFEQREARKTDDAVRRVISAPAAEAITARARALTEPSDRAF